MNDLSFLHTQKKDSTQEELVLELFKRNIDSALSHADWSTFYELLSNKHNICVDNRGFLYRVDNGLPEAIEIIDVKDIFVKCIKGLGLDTKSQVQATNAIINTLKNSNGIAYIPTVATDNHIDDKGSIVREFRNGTLTITKNGTSWIERDSARVVWNYINRDYTPFTGSLVNSDLDKLSRAFCTPKDGDITTDYDKKAHDTYRLILGASTHRHYKDDQSFAIMLLDKRSDSSHGDVARGGRGKGLTAKIMKNAIPREAFLTTEYKKNNHFQWQNVSLKTRLIQIDELAPKDMGDLYSKITEPLTVEQKNRTSYEIGGYEHPRFIITSNYVQGSGESTQRRLLRFNFTDFFCAKNTPTKMLGHSIMQEYTPGEWSTFDTYINQCAIDYLEFTSKGNSMMDLTPTSEENAFQEVLDDSTGFNDFLMNSFYDSVEVIANPQLSDNEYLSDLVNLDGDYELIKFKDITDAFKMSEDIISENDAYKWKAAFSKFRVATSTFMSWTSLRTRNATRSGDRGNVNRWQYSINDMDKFLRFIKIDVSASDLIDSHKRDAREQLEIDNSIHIR